jgi:hypothetical protein
MAQKHSRKTERGRLYWYTERLWQLARDLPIKTVAIDTISKFDQNCWFSDEQQPTCRRVASHAKRIFEADLSCPIILSSDGYLMDGGHRIARAWLMGRSEIDAVQFVVDPEPDWVALE